MTPEFRKTPGRRRTISLALIPNSGAKAEPRIEIRTEAGQGTPLERSTSAAWIVLERKSDLWRPAPRPRQVRARQSCTVRETLGQTPDSARHTLQRHYGELHPTRKEPAMP